MVLRSRGAPVSPIGAWPESGGFSFRVWAPGARLVELALEGPGALGTIPLERDREGYHGAFVPRLGRGELYRYRVGGLGPYPDPASRSQPHGVHGPSETVDPDSYRWRSPSPRCVQRDLLVIYEVHVGTFSREGTFRGVSRRLDHLTSLGVTALELMPVASFPGKRNWGYDGVAPYAPAACYGGPEALRGLVDAAHGKGLSVILDVVYNHFGPDGAYVWCLAPEFFDRKASTPWGRAIRFGGPGSRAVRDFFVANAVHWIHEYRVDGLRLDATHAIVDRSRTHILREISDRVRASLPAGRNVVLIAEDASNEARLVRPPGRGGFGLDAVWADDFHHQVRVALCGDRDGYYVDYCGTAEEIARTLERGWFYEGQTSTYSGGPRGTPSAGLPPEAFVHCLQNHDQIGNRAMGDRLHHRAGPGAWRAASVLLLTSPHVPLLFMGQEWAASTPFLFFTDHHQKLGAAVTRGRRREFATFEQFSTPTARRTIPDPQSELTFQRSRLRWNERSRAPHRGILRLYRDLLRLRSRHRVPADGKRRRFAVESVGRRGLVMRRDDAGGSLLVVVNLGGDLDLEISRVSVRVRGRSNRWCELLVSESRRYGGDPGTVQIRRDERGVVVRLVFGGPGAVILEGES